MVIEATNKVAQEFKTNSEGATTAYVSEHHKLDTADATEWLSGTEWACDLQVNESTLSKTQEALVAIGQLDKPVDSERIIASALCRLTK